MKKQFLFIVSIFLIAKPCFASTLRMTEFGLLIPTEFFFKIAEYIVPNLLKPIHPKEIMSQDQELKPYRLVCTTWRDLLDQRVDFEYMMRLFVIDNGWPYGKCLNNLCLRWAILKSSYNTKNEWFVNQAEKKRHVKKQRFNNEYGNKVDNILNNLEQTAESCSVRSHKYYETMKEKLKRFEYDGLLKLRDYIANKGFLSTNSLTGNMFNFYAQTKDDGTGHLKELVLVCDFTCIIGLLFEKFVFYVFYNQSCCLSLLHEAKINYPHFLNRVYLSFFQRIEKYKRLLWFDHIQHFFTDYKGCFTLKDDRNKLFLYYLLLYSRDDFFEIQMMLLTHFIKSTQKELVNYQEDEQFEYKKLFKKNFLNRFKRPFSKEAQFLKKYFGYSG